MPLTTWQDKEVLNGVNNALSGLKNFTDVLSAEKHVTVSAIKPILDHFCTDILSVKEEDVQLTKDIKSKVMAYLEDKYTDPEVNKLLDMAGFVDPRFKTNFIDSKDLGTIKNSITVEAMAIATKEREDGDARVDLTIATHGTHEPPAKKKKVTLGSILKQTTESRSADTGSRTSLEDKVKKEIDAVPKARCRFKPIKVVEEKFCFLPYHQC